MLDKLVESKNNGQENKLRNRLLGTTFSLAAIGVVFAFILSLYTFELSLGNSDLDISTLTAPVMIDEPKVEEPPPAAAMPKQLPTTVQSVTKVPTRVENIQRVEETPVKPPTEVSVTPPKTEARPNAPFTIGKVDSNPPTTSYQTSRGEGTGTGTGNSNGISNNTQSRVIDEIEKEVPVIKPPVVKETPKEPEKKNVVVSGGVVNGKATSLVQPTYPSAARAVGAVGKVEVRVTIDETGRVIAANVISGHALLRDSALSAARNSKFTPTMLSGERVKVSGVIVYNFNAQ